MDGEEHASAKHRVAEAMGVSLPTVDRWLEGKSMPHPKMLPLAFRKLLSLACGGGK